jgi:dephospho-CoA kinase
MMRMPLIGLTGGIAAGKTVVASRLAELGAIVVDADALAREVVAPGAPALARIESEFGASVIAPDGTLDRAALGAIIFADAERRTTLNAITHPAVGELAAQRIAAAFDADPDAVVVYDVPLLAEGGLHDRFDAVVVVHADAERRIRRLVEHRGLSEQEARHRLNSQASDTERLAIADIVIDANGTLEQTLEQADQLWRSLRERQVD